MSRFAFDIETVSPDVPHDQKPNFDDSGDFEFLISAVGYQADPGAEIETELFFRDGWTPEAEVDVIESTLDWFDSRDGDTLLTYNGERFDLIHLRGRAEIAGTSAYDHDDLVARVESFLAGIEHDDVRDDARAAYGGYPSLEGTCKKNDVEVVETPLEEYGFSEERLNKTRSSKVWGKDHLVSQDVPVIGEEYLGAVNAGETDTEAFENMREGLAHYARADIRPLFELADKRPFATAPDAR